MVVMRCVVVRISVFFTLEREKNENKFDLSIWISILEWIIVVISLSLYRSILETSHSIIGIKCKSEKFRENVNEFDS